MSTAARPALEHEGPSNFTNAIPDNAIAAETKICEQGSSGGCQITFIRTIGSQRKVCDYCLSLNIASTRPVHRDPVPDAAVKKEIAWSEVKKITQQEHLDRVCNRKFPYPRISDALNVIKSRKKNHAHDKDRVGALQAFRCPYQIHDSPDEARRGLHFHIGGRHEAFEGSDF